VAGFVSVGLAACLGAAAVFGAVVVVLAGSVFLVAVLAGLAGSAGFVVFGSDVFLVAGLAGSAVFAGFVVFGSEAFFEAKVVGLATPFVFVSVVTTFVVVFPFVAVVGLAGSAVLVVVGLASVVLETLTFSERRDLASFLLLDKSAARF